MNYRTLETLFFIAVILIGYIAISDLIKVIRQINHWLKNKFKK
jgi:hypothetical protein